MTEIQKIGQLMKIYRLSCVKRKLPARVIDVANQLGISPALLCHYETGNRKIQLDFWLKWCKVLGIKPRTILERLEKYNAQN